MEDAKLSDYKDYNETESCYLDGRYFNLVLSGLYEGISTKPLTLTIDEHTRHSTWKGIIKTDIVNFIRVVIQSDEIRHAALLIVDYPGNKVIFWNPISGKSDKDGLMDAINNLIKDVVLDIGAFKIYYENHTVLPYESNEKCKLRGYCNAYVIKYVLDWLDDAKYNDKNILKFVSAIEDKYSHFLTGEPDVEFAHRGGGGGGHRGGGGGGYGRYGGGGGFGGLAGLGTGLLLGSALAGPRYGYGYGYPAPYPYPYPYGYYV